MKQPTLFTQFICGLNKRSCSSRVSNFLVRFVEFVISSFKMPCCNKCGVIRVNEGGRKRDLSKCSELMLCLPDFIDMHLADLIG